MPPMYKCLICETRPDQLSHHKSHLETQKHIDKKTIFELKLNSLGHKDLQEKYKSTDIKKIIEEY